MTDVKNSSEVSYTADGEAGKQCKDCVNFTAIDDKSGNYFNHKVSVLGSCNNYAAK